MRMILAQATPDLREPRPQQQFERKLTPRRGGQQSSGLRPPARGLEWGEASSGTGRDSPFINLKLSQPPMGDLFVRLFTCPSPRNEIRGAGSRIYTHHVWLISGATCAAGS